MRHWEEAGVLTELLDRHVHRLTTTGESDWTIYHALAPFLRFLDEEPILAAFVRDYLDELAVFYAKRDGRLKAIHARAAAILAEHEAVLVTTGDSSPESDERGSVRQSFADAESAIDRAGAHEPLQRACDRLGLWVEQARAERGDEVEAAKLTGAAEQVHRLQSELKQIIVRTEREMTSDPGIAYAGLHECLRGVDHAVSDDSVADELHNKHAERVRGLIRTAEQFAGLAGDLPQPGVVNIQRAVTRLHLALATSLGRGRSRWAVVRRFAARCETFDREHLVQQVASAGNKPEAVLTLAFARYLFDAGFNPLVDAAACGLRPDVLDATSAPAIYVEAKQYERVGDALAAAVRKDLAQTVNTWSRLGKRWHLPEAFLLIFRRSGRPIELERTEARINGRRLYVLVVDLASPEESGSRARQAVRINVANLLPKEAS